MPRERFGAPARPSCSLQNHRAEAVGAAPLIVPCDNAGDYRLRARNPWRSISAGPGSRRRSRLGGGASGPDVFRLPLRCLAARAAAWGRSSAEVRLAPQRSASWCDCATLATAARILVVVGAVHERPSRSRCQPHFCSASASWATAWRQIAGQVEVPGGPGAICGRSRVRRRRVARAEDLAGPVTAFSTQKGRRAGRTLRLCRRSHPFS